MKRYIIIEDERFAYEELKRMIQSLRKDYELAGWAQSVEQAVVLVARGDYDFIITDIRLSDGLCFDVFERQPSNAPVIFTTAYDEYALKAFDLNSIDYLLKPVDESDLAVALDKLELNMLTRADSSRYTSMAQTYMSNTHKSRFLIHIGDTYRYVLTTDVALFYSEEKTTYLHTLEGRSYIIDYSLDYIEQVLPQDQFFRLSRACIANIRSIGKVSKFFGGRLSVELLHIDKEREMVSRKRAADFLKWLGGDV